MATAQLETPLRLHKPRMANTHNAKGHRNGHAAQLSNEALIFRSVLRTHIARQLQHQMLNVPVGLLSDANAQYKTGNDDLVTYDELERVFDDVTTNFENSCHEQLASSGGCADDDSGDRDSSGGCHEQHTYRRTRRMRGRMVATVARICNNDRTKMLT